MGTQSVINAWSPVVALRMRLLTMRAATSRQGVLPVRSGQMVKVAHIPGGSALPGGVRRGYALGSIVTGAFNTVPGLLLLPYLTDRLAIPAAAAGLLVLLPKAWDVVLNPIAGRISDRTHTRIGPRRPYLLGGGVLLAVCFAALFAAPGLTGTTAAIYVGVMFLLCATGFASFQVPYLAMPAEMTPGYHERTRLMGARVAVLAVAILVSGAGAPALVQVGDYRLMGAGVGTLLLLGTVGVFVTTAPAPLGEPRSSAAGWRDTAAAIRESRSFRWLLAAFVIQALGIGTVLAGVNYVSRLVLGDPAAQTWLFAAFVAPALLVMPALQRLGRRFGKRRCYRGCSVLFALGVLGFLAASVAPLAAILGCAVLAGIGYAGMQVFPLAMLPDAIGAAERRTGRVRAGAFSGVWTAGETLGMALGAALYGWVLAAGGYVASAAGQVTQPLGAVTAALLGFGLIPAMLVLAGCLLLRKNVVEEEAV